MPWISGQFCDVTVLEGKRSIRVSSILELCGKLTLVTRPLGICQTSRQHFAYGIDELPSHLRLA
jgi:hypothetical protein